MEKEDEKKTNDALEPAKDSKKSRKSGGHTIPAQMI